MEYKLSKAGIDLSTHEILNGLADFEIDEIDYKVDKLYMISDKRFESNINKEIFKFKQNVLLTNEFSKALKKCSDFS
ncbi:hypothetical protein [Dethiosulfatibacter aminovorans]|uniref:hypothetical protein n=1 Tax=Dethiosulfatibacter aminovorans TaxID=332095 RepID=UPI00093227F9|nr:hypothetical protein [Dethiosulfatibacter aminovorans]